MQTRPTGCFFLSFASFSATFSSSEGRVSLSSPRDRLSDVGCISPSSRVWRIKGEDTKDGRRMESAEKTVDLILSHLIHTEFMLTGRILCRTSSATANRSPLRIWTSSARREIPSSPRGLWMLGMGEFPASRTSELNSRQTSFGWVWMWRNLADGWNFTVKPFPIAQFLTDLQGSERAGFSSQ